ncbi:MAG: DUF362 domain-containing protein [Lachnospiraceae bacterium]|nr:DUF362 domain-containing protein [Lachnospiraceae bacterium]
MNKNDVWMIYGTEYKEMTKRILEASDLSEMIADKDCRIGIKPNLVSPSEASYGATTHPEVVAGIIEYLREHGCTQIVMLESSWVGDKTSDALLVCGYDRLSEQYGVEFLDLQKDGSRIYDCAGMDINICDEAKKLDFLINVPVLKGHCQTKMTCALKNMKGLIPNKEKRHFHSMGLHKPIAHLNTGVHQDFIVVDNICGDLDFEDGGHPVQMDRIMTFADPVLCDAFACRMLHYTKKDVPYVELAEKLGVGSADIAHAKMHNLNEQDRAVRKNAREILRSERKIVAVKDTVQEVESCSACYGSLIPALDRLKEEGLLDHLTDKISIGQGYRGKSGKLGVGSCTREFTFSCKGCPPTEEEIYNFLKGYIAEA